MSIDALQWAWRVRAGSSAGKLVLLALADRSSEDHASWPSSERLALDTELDRKTILAALRRLAADGLIQDTGRRAGRTRQVIVWQLVGVVGREDQPVKQSQNRNGSENGTVTKTEQFQIRNSTENGTVPKTGHRTLTKTTKQNTHTPPASCGRIDPLADSIPVPKAMAHCAPRARALLRNALPEDRAAIVAQVDSDDVRDHAAYLAKLCAASRAGEYLPPTRGLIADPNRSQLEALNLRRLQATSNYTGLKRLLEHATGESAVGLQRQVERSRAELHQIDDELRALAELTDFQPAMTTG